MSKQVYSEGGSLVNRRLGPEGWAALNKSLPCVRLTEDASQILLNYILIALDERAGAGFTTAFKALEDLGLASELTTALYDGVMEYVSQMAEAAFIAGAELGYRGLVMQPAEDQPGGES